MAVEIILNNITPTNVPTTPPFPPLIEEPPITTAPMASVSIQYPVVACAALIRDSITMLAMPTRTPLMAKNLILFHLTLRPEIYAARSFVPIAYTCLPVLVCFKI